MSPKGTRAEMSCARYTKWHFQNYAEHLERDQRRGSREGQRMWEMRPCKKMLEGFGLLVENENMLRKVAGIFFRSSKEESNKIFYVSRGGNMGEQYKNRC